LLGLQWTVIALAMLNLGLGAVAYWQSHDVWASWWRAPLIAGAATVALIVTAPSGYFLGFREGPSEHLVFYEEGVETTVAVFHVPDHHFKVSFVNGRIEVPTDEISMAAFRLLGHLPALLKPDAQGALMLSFGNGIATGSLDTHSIPVIDAVDLSAEQFAAAKLYEEENHNVLRSPRLHTHVEDGRNFLLQTSRRYDIITVDATHPTNTSSWALFTREFYQQVAEHLTPEGVFVQWMPFHSLTEEDYQAILRTFQSVFPHATLWYTGGTHTLLVATPERLNAEQVLEIARAADAIVRDELGAPEKIAAYLAMDEDELRAYVGDGDIVTDSIAYFLPDNADTSRIRALFE
jgi:spermidine synthase